MRPFTPKTTIAIGLVSIVVSTMVSVMFMGIGPNPRKSAMAGRAQLCESIAIHTSLHLSRNDFLRIEALMESIVRAQSGSTFGGRPARQRQAGNRRWESREHLET